MKIAIIDYKAGNAPSVMHAVKHIGSGAGLAHGDTTEIQPASETRQLNAKFVRSAQDLADATHIILPGVGSAKATMESLREMDLIGPLEDAVLRRKVNFLGICVGLQILFEHSEEENTKCLGWLEGNVVKFDSGLRVPQMGWNKVVFSEWDDFFYFVNSYYAKPKNKADIWGTANYGGVFAAAVCKENICATQFHIEKSGEAGLNLLTGFLRKGCGQC